MSDIEDRMPPSDNWPAIRAWRRQSRELLLRQRKAISRRHRQTAREEILDLLNNQMPFLVGGRIGFYWPFAGEIDLRGLVGAQVRRGAVAALPVVVIKRQPLEFWAWRPGIALRPGIWKIPIPAERRVIRPTVLLVPLLGFDDAGYRLGYGGGYYDRTIAAMQPRPLLIGVGYESARLPSIQPQPHDIAMSAIVTEAGIRWCEKRRDRIASNPAPAFPSTAPQAYRMEGLNP